MKYYYKDFETGKLHYTRAPFGGWTQPAGLLNTPYAVFIRKADIMYIPEYLLTAETRQSLPQPEAQQAQA